MATYATIDDLKAYAPQATAGVADAELETTLVQAEGDVDRYGLPVMERTDAGLKYDPPVDLDTLTATSLRDATCAQAEYRLYMGPALFIEGGRIGTGGDITLDKPPPLLAPKAQVELLEGGLMPMTGSMTRRVAPSRQKRFTW
jgi:hypothetical protein